MFEKGVYIVVLDKPNRNTRYVSPGYVYKQASRNITLWVLEDNTESECNCSDIVYEDQNKTWRYATAAEIVAYDENGGKPKLVGTFSNIKEFKIGDVVRLTRKIIEKDWNYLHDKDLTIIQVLTTHVGVFLRFSERNSLRSNGCVFPSKVFTHINKNNQVENIVYTIKIIEDEE